MKIVAAYFDRKNKYKILLEVFKKSIKAIMPKVEVNILKTEEPKNISRKNDMAHAFNVAAKQAINSGCNVAVCDIDLLFIKSIEPAFKLDFDVAVTVRSKYKYNTGLWFMKPTAAAIKFVRLWIKCTKYLMLNAELESEIIEKYAGIDQASLAMAIKTNHNAKILELPCTEWNSCQGEWKDFNNDTRVLHIKSALRGVAVKRKQPIEGQEYIIPLAEMWRAYL